MQICGIDDAGRGAMLGPLVIAGVSLDKKNLRKLTSLGVKDSKKLSPKKKTKIAAGAFDALVEHILSTPMEAMDYEGVRCAPLLTKAF